MNLNGQTAEEAFNEHFRDHSSMEHHHESLQKMLQAQAKVRRINEARKEEEVPADKDEVVEEEGVKLVGEAEAAMHDVHDMDYDTIGLSERIAMLNKDQRRIFEQVFDHLNHQRRQQRYQATPHVCQWSWRNWKVFPDRNYKKSS